MIRASSKPASAAAQKLVTPKPTRPSKKQGDCCPIMSMVIRRDVATKGTPRGFEIATMWHLSGKAMREALVYRFPKAKRGDDSEFGAKSEYADATFAPVKHCPFCGETLK